MTRHQKNIKLGEQSHGNLKVYQIGEPILLNPNSYNNLADILDTLKKHLDIGMIREWRYIGCDGPPYFLTSRLIENKPQKYDWVTLLIGLGHLNINQIKGYFKVMDKICFNVLGSDVLNFKSPTAYKYSTEAKDNHKSWQAFEILLHGTMLELIHTCSLQCKEDISPIGFLKWQRETTSGTMKVIFQLVLTQGLGIYA